MAKIFGDIAFTEDLADTFAPQTYDGTTKKVLVKKDFSDALTQISNLTGEDRTAAKIVEILHNAL